MRKFTIALVCILLVGIFAITPVLATETDANTVQNTTNTTNNTESETRTPATLDDDLYVSNDTNFEINHNVNGNAFITTGDLTITSRNITNLVFNGDLFAASTNTSIKSDLVYSDNKDKIGNYIVSNIKSYTNFNGNVYVQATESFTMETGCQIHGDLYVFASTVNINESAIITGNLYVFANSTLNMHGRVYGSVYAITSDFNMNYTGNISKDLILRTKNANISGKINRTAKIESDSGKVVFGNDFVVTKNLQAEAINLQFAGEVQGDALIKTKILTFDTSKLCIIRGNLEYSVKNEVSIPDGVVLGDSKSEKYVDDESFSSILIDKLVGALSFVVYVFVVALIFKRISPTLIEKLSNINTTNIFTSFGVAFGVILLAVPAFVLFLFIKFTIPLAFMLLLALIFVSFIAIPLFILAIANAWDYDKFNLYVRVLIISLVIYVFSLIPYFGPTVLVCFMLVSIGKILSSLFYVKKADK